MAVLHPDPALAPGPTIYPGMDWPPDGTAPAPAPSTFEVYLTDLYGNVLTWVDDVGVTESQIKQYTSLSVQLTVNDDRTAKVTLSLYHPAVQNVVKVSGEHRIAALGRMVRIRYRGTTIFWGPITQPKFSAASGTVELQCQGPCFKLRHRELNYSDPIVTSDTAEPGSADVVQNPSDWRTIKAIVEAAYDLPSQYDINVPDIGVNVVNVSGKNAPAAFWIEIERGSKNWDKIQEVTESYYGGEFDVVPHDPSSDELPFDMTMYEELLP